MTQMCLLVYITLITFQLVYFSFNIFINTLLKEQHVLHEQEGGKDAGGHGHQDGQEVPARQKLHRVRVQDDWTTAQRCTWGSHDSTLFTKVTKNQNNIILTLNKRKKDEVNIQDTSKCKYNVAAFCFSYQIFLLAKIQISSRDRNCCLAFYQKKHC